MNREPQERGARTGQAYQRALDKLELAEKRLARHFTVWQKARIRVRALSKKLDALGGASEFAGCVTCKAHPVTVDFMGECGQCATEPALSETAIAKELAAAAGY